MIRVFPGCRTPWHTMVGMCSVCAPVRHGSMRGVRATPHGPCCRCCRGWIAGRVSHALLSRAGHAPQPVLRYQPAAAASPAPPSPPAPQPSGGVAWDLDRCGSAPAAAAAAAGSVRGRHTQPFTAGAERRRGRGGRGGGRGGGAGVGRAKQRRLSVLRGHLLSARPDGPVRSINNRKRGEGGAEARARMQCSCPTSCTSSCFLRTKRSHHLFPQAVSHRRFP